jgi:hypothetical protein
MSDVKKQDKNSGDSIKYGCSQVRLQRFRKAFGEAGYIIASAWKQYSRVVEKLSTASEAKESCLSILSRFTLTTMPQALPVPPPGFDPLSIDDPIDYVQSLWDRIETE